MDADFIAFVLENLDADERAALEALLRESQEAQRRLESLRQALDALAAELHHPAPQDLAHRTCTLLRQVLSEKCGGGDV